MKMSRSWLQAVTFALGVMGIVAFPSVGLAQTEITGVIGGLLGGDLNNIIAGTASIKTTFDNGPLYGVKVGYVPRWVGFEFGFVGSPSGVKISLPNQPLKVDGIVSYAEGNFLVIPIPGPVSPYFTVGAGWHHYRLDVLLSDATRQGENIDKFGWNLGGGLKINIKHVTLRGEIRDHITKLGPDDFHVGDIAEELGFTDSATVHNVEISGGIGFRF